MNKIESAVRSIKNHVGLTSRSPLVTFARPAYDLVLNALYGRRGMERLINAEESIRIRAMHRYAHEDYEPQVYAYLKNLVKPGAVILDIGAHIGLFTILLARWAGDRGRIFAFEPTPATRAALLDHLTLNGVAERVEVIASAVSHAVGQAEFHAVAFSPENTLNPAHTRLGEAEAVQVPVTTIDEFCAKQNVRPTLIKIDIEGFELHALRGAKKTLAAHRPAVLVEMHPMNWEEMGESVASATATLAALGYRATPLEGQLDPLSEYGHVVLEPIE